MAKTLEEIKDFLKRLDEVTLCEVLDISSEDLVNRFEDLIEDKADQIEQDLEEDPDEEDSY